MTATSTSEQAAVKAGRRGGMRLAGEKGNGGKGKWRNGEEMNEVEGEKNGGWNSSGKMKRRREAE